MKVKSFLFVLFLAIQALSINLFAQDELDYSALGLENDNLEAAWFEASGFASGAEFAGYMEVKDGDLFFEDGNSSLATTVSGGTASSVTIHWGTSATSGTDRVLVYARKTAYDGEETTGAGTLVATITCDGSSKQTFSSFGDSYSFVLLVSDYRAYVSSVDISWSTRTAHDIAKSFTSSKGSVTTKIGPSSVTSAYKDDVVSVRITKKTGYAIVGYEVYQTSNSSNKLVNKSLDYELAAQSFTFTMPDYDVTVAAYYDTAPTKDLEISIVDASSNDFTDLDAMVSGESLTYTYTVNSDYAGYVSVESSNTSIARVALSKTNAYSGTLTITPYSTGSVTITMKFGSDGKYYANTINAATATVSRRAVALVTEYQGKYYAVTTDLSDSKFAPMELLSEDGNYYFDPSRSYDESDVTWYVETIYNAEGNQYRIFSTSSGSSRIRAYGETFSLSTTDFTWLKAGTRFYGFEGSKGLVFNNLATAFVAKDYEAYGTMSQFSQSAFEVPIADIQQAHWFRRGLDPLEADLVDPNTAKALTDGQFITICVPFSVPMSFVHGGTFYQIVGKYVSGDNLTGISIEEVDELEEGHSYLVQMSSDALDIYFAKDLGIVYDVTASTDDSDGFIGALWPDSNVAKGGVTPRKDANYGISTNQLRYITTDHTVNIHRAVIAAGELSLVGGGVSPSPRRRVLTVYGAENVATDLSNISDASSINWNEPVYNIMGMQVGKGATGVLIQNGQKFFVQ